MRKLMRQAALCALLLLYSGVQAQETKWSSATYETPSGQVPSAQSHVDPFQIDFVCEPSQGSPPPLVLAVKAKTDSGQTWVQAFASDGFDVRVRLLSGNTVIGHTQTQSRHNMSQVVLNLTANGDDLDHLMIEQDLRLEFEDLAGLNVFDLTLPDRGLGAALCPILARCGHDTTNLCSIFTAIETASTQAIPLRDSLARDAEGKPQWFKSQYQAPLSTLPYHRTASIFDPHSGSELHVSCLAEDGQALALNFVAGPGGGNQAPFVGQDYEPAELVWEVGDKAGRWTQFIPFGDGYGMGREGIQADLLTRATLEVLMTTDQSIQVGARQGSAQVLAEFTPKGSRDAICPVMKGCGISLGFSPACTTR